MILFALVIIVAVLLLVLGFEMFLVLGVVKVMYAFAFRPLSGWGWVLFSGIISLLLGVMILADMPWAAATILGILLAVELLSNGVFLLFIAFGLRGAQQT